MTSASGSAAGPARIALVDVSRGLALAGMAIYHFCWDLEFFSLAAPGLVANPALAVFADVITASFLFLVGVGLVLAHAGGFRARPFARRLAMIAAAAIAITVASVVFDPDGIILFGILHFIAVASVLGLLFLRLPIAVTLLAAAACFIAPPLLKSGFFNAPALLWLGLASDPPPSNDYVPLLPWFSAVLAGIAVARLVLPRIGGWRWSHWQPQNTVSRTLAFAGRHSLIVYLVHQPVLLAILWAATQLTGAGTG